MISRQFRFHGYGSLNFTYRRGQTVRGQWLALRYVANSRHQSYRAAVVVSRKVHKSAVVRNRIRRRIYEIVRLELPTNVPPHDLIFTVYSEQVADVSAAQLKRAVRRLLRQAGLI
jgi:ribonuclease P protein component